MDINVHIDWQYMIVVSFTAFMLFKIMDQKSRPMPPIVKSYSVLGIALMYSLMFWLLGQSHFPDPKNDLVSYLVNYTIATSAYELIVKSILKRFFGDAE